MFDNCLDFCLEFIAVQPPQTGCSSAQLGDFICEDLLPYQGLAADATMRDIVVRLLLSTRTEAFTVQAVRGEKRQRDTKPRCRPSKPSSPNKKSSTAPVQSADASSEELRDVFAHADVLTALDEGRLQWDIPSSTNISTQIVGATQSKLLYFVPSHALRERVLGFTITSEALEMTTRFMAENSFLGWDAVPCTAEFSAHYKLHLLRNGIKTLLRSRKITRCYLCRSGSESIEYRYFPRFAAPLTEQEKTEQPVSMTATGTEEGEEHSSVLGVQLRRCRRWQPLAHYFARQRASAAVDFPATVFDLRAIHSIVRRAPEGRLLMHDAIHAALATHHRLDARWEDIGRTERKRMRDLLCAAGLRIVAAAVQLRGRRRRVLLVMPAEDLVEDGLHSAESPQKRYRVEGEAPTDGEDANEDASIDSGSATDSGSDEEGEDEEASPSSDEQRDSQVPRAQLLVATMVLRAEAGMPVEVQAAHEAECRPLALRSVLPRMRFQLHERLVFRDIGRFLERYMKLWGTVEMQRMVLGRQKAFQLVYRPRSPSLSSGPAAAAGEAPPTVAGATAATGARMGPAPPPPPATAPGLSSSEHFASDDARLPKGLSAYAANTLLEVLRHAMPHHAASLPRLRQSFDITTLGRRVLPFLREQRMVYTTSTQQRGRKHVGMVVLVQPGVVPLDEVAKQAVLAAEADEMANNESSTATSTIAVGAASASRSARTMSSTLVLEAVPAMTAGSAHAASAAPLLRIYPAATKAVNAVMAVRNGYARTLLQRLSRLHLELWWQHFTFPNTTDKASAAAVPSSLACEVMDRLSLSTYCVVVGLPQGDMAGLMRGGGGGEAEGTRFGWSSPLRSLPPSLYGWCRQQGVQMLCACLNALHDRGLVRSNDNFHDLLQAGTRENVRYTLAPFATMDGCTHHFIPETGTGTPASTLYACMRYWLPQWCRRTAQADAAAERVLDAEPNPSVPQVVALSRVLRRDAGLLAMLYYQEAGGRRPEEWKRRHSDAAKRRPLHLDFPDDAEGDEEAHRQRADTDDNMSVMDERTHSARRTALELAEREEEGGGAHSGLHARDVEQHTAVRRRWNPAAPRTEVSGDTVAEALEVAFDHHAPWRQVEAVVRFLLRARAVQIHNHPLFIVPAALPSVLRRGTDLTSTRTSTAVAGTAYATEFNTDCSGQGGSTYNRLLTRSVLHMGSLAVALQTVRLQQRSPAAVPLSFTESLRDDLKSIFAPDAAFDEESVSTDFISFPNATREATTLTAAQLQERAAVAGSFEVVTDILRMILLSDQAHYRASTAKSLLSAINDGSLITRARAFLQRLPSYLRTARTQERIPLLSLGHRPTVLQSAALHGAPRLCGNIALFHDWAAALDTAAGVCAAGRERPALPLLDLPGLLRAESADVLQWSTPSIGLRMVRQPAVDVRRLTAAHSAVRGALGEAPLPLFDWPEGAAACERDCAAEVHEAAREEPSADEEGEEVEEDVSASAGRKRRRPAVLDGLRKRRCSAAGSGRRSAEVETRRQLYPARSVCNHDDPAYLQELPVDPTPTEAELAAVERSRVLLAAGPATMSAQLDTVAAASRCGLSYPSIFHHIDGGFHAYMWHNVLHVVFRYLLRVPGILHEDLEARLMTSGLLSRRAVLAVMNFLVDQGLVRVSETETVARCEVAGCGVLDAAPRALGPFQQCSKDVVDTAVGPIEIPWSRRCYTPVGSLEALRRSAAAM